MSLSIRKRPFGVTLLATGVLMIAVVAWLGLVNAVQFWMDAPVTLLRVSPVYLVLRNVFWGIAWSVLGWGLLRGAPWAAKITRITVILFIALYWFERYILVVPENFGSNLLFAAGISLLAILLAWWVLSRPQSKEFFGEMYEQRS